MSAATQQTSPPYFNPFSPPTTSSTRLVSWFTPAEQIVEKNIRIFHELNRQFIGSFEDLRTSPALLAIDTEILAEAQAERNRYVRVGLPIIGTTLFARQRAKKYGLAGRFLNPLKILNPIGIKKTHIGKTRLNQLDANVNNAIVTLKAHKNEAANGINLIGILGEKLNHAANKISDYIFAATEIAERKARVVRTEVVIATSQEKLSSLTENPWFKRSWTTSREIRSLRREIRATQNDLKAVQREQRKYDPKASKKAAVYQAVLSKMVKGMERSAHAKLKLHRELRDTAIFIQTEAKHIADLRTGEAHRQSALKHQKAQQYHHDKARHAGAFEDMWHKWRGDSYKRAQEDAVEAGEILTKTATFHLTRQYSALQHTIKYTGTKRPESGIDEQALFHAILTGENFPHMRASITAFDQVAAMSQENMPTRKFRLLSNQSAIPGGTT